MEKKPGLNISARSFIIAIAVIFLLMVVSYALTFFVPAGSFARTVDEAGNTMVDVNSEFTFTDGSLPFWKWILSPILVLGAEGNVTLIAVIAFLLIIGGVFAGLTSCGLLNYMLAVLCAKFRAVKYKLLAVVILFFMLMGAFVGSFEEIIPMVPIVVALAVGLGWDALTGLGMSIISVGCGFSSGLFNPFTVGVAQTLAGLPLFSGVWLRFITLLVIYPTVLFFVSRHAKKVERPVEELEDSFVRRPELDKAMLWFVIIIGTGILIDLSSTVISALQDYTMIVICLMFLAAGIICPIIAKADNKAKVFFMGVADMAPAVLMILMASSIRFILEQGGIIDTLLYYSITAASGFPRWAVVLFIYLIVMIMNFFVSSGSAKAFMLIPLLVPMAQAFDISSQLVVVAFACGDGFSNIFYPTNAGTLIALSLADVDYGSWAKWTAKLQLVILVFTSAILLLGLSVGY